jgi:replicative DNA helicase
MNYDLQIERELLGTIITYPESMKHLDGLSDDHFYDATHRDIYAEIMRMVADSEKISIAKLSLNVDKAYLASIVSSQRVLDMQGAASVLIELHSRRFVSGVALMACDAIDRGASSAEAMQLLSPLSTGHALEAQSRTMHDSGRVTDSIIEDIISQVKPFSTGIKKLDDCMDGGMYPKKAYGIAARKKVGKTIMLGTVSHNLNLAGVKHLFICGEMGEKEIHQRVLARALDIYPSAFRTGYAERPETVQKLKDYNRQAPRNTIYLDAPAITFDRLKHAVVTAHMRHGIKGFILDYWQLVAGKGGRDSEAFHLGEVAQWIAEICRKLDMWALVAAQINQDGNTRGGEGMRLAFDQVYHLQPVGEDGGDITLPARWLEMMDTRYTQWANIGSPDMAGLMLNEKGLFFEEVASDPRYSYA